MLSRRDLIKTMALSTATVGGVSALAPEPYNVLFLMSDEHSPHVAGCFGNKIVQTPAIDSLAGIEGHSLVPLMKGTDSGKDRYALSESFRGNSAGRMIRSGPWKYCYFKEDCPQLFNLKDDPEEAVNLVQAPQHRDLVASLKSRALHDWDYAENLKKYENKAAENRKNGVKEEL